MSRGVEAILMGNEENYVWRSFINLKFIWIHLFI